MKNSCGALIILLFISCTKTVDNKTVDTLTADSIPKNKKTETVCIHKDTVTLLGTRIKYISDRGKFKISWADNAYNRVYDSLYTCIEDENGTWDFVPKLIYETKDKLVFTNILYTSSGSNPAPLEYYAIVCPKNSNGSVFEKDFFIMSKGDYLVYGDPYNENLHLLNLETDQEQDIILKPKPYVSRSPTLSIQNTSIDKNTLYIKYETLDKNDELKIVNTKFKMKI